MADSVDTNIFVASWTEVQQGVSGLITNNSGHDIIIREAASDPGTSVTTGHPLNPTGPLTYNLNVGQKVFARAVTVDTFVVVTGA